MLRKRVHSGLVAVVMFAVVGCAQNVHRVDSASYGYVARDDFKISELQPVIENTVSGEGWTLSDVKTGKFTGMKEWGGGKHKIVIEVSYSAKNFSIGYKDSTAMKYTGSSIHHTYNEMVIKLENAIKAAVSLL